MSADALAPEPAWYAQVPRFQQVDVFYREHLSHGSDQVWIEYGGAAEDLIAAGVATAAMLVINPPRGRRVKRVDQDGDPFRLVRYWRSSKDGQECPPYRYFRLTRLKPESRVGGLPGAREAIAADNGWQKWRAARDGQVAQEVRKPPPVLRLVVNNTSDLVREQRR
jgi:hypothetical protein